MSSCNQKYIKIADNIINNRATLNNLISAKNFINKELLVRPEKCATTNNTNNSTKSQSTSDEIDSIFKEWDILEMKIIGKPKEHFVVPNSTIITNKRQTQMLPPLLRKSYENLTTSSCSFFDIQVPYSSTSTPLHNKTFKKSKSKDFGELSSMMMETTKNASNIDNEYYSKKVTEELLNNVDKLTNQQFSDITIIAESNKHVFKDLMENVNNLKEFLNNFEAYLSLVTETNDNQKLDNANVIDVEFCKRIGLINEV